MTENNKIDYLEFPSADLDRTQQFYGSIFNWEFTDYGPEYRAFSDGRMQGGFYLSDKCSDAATGAVLVVFFSKDLESTYDTVVEHGGTISTETFSFPGGRRFHFKDPNGNELAVWTDI